MGTVSVGNFRVRVLSAGFTWLARKVAIRALGTVCLALLDTGTSSQSSQHLRGQ